MSTYYQCRLNKLELDLSSRPDILQWLKDCKDIRDEIKQKIYNDREPKIPDGITLGSRCEQLFYNSFEGSNSYDNDLYLDIEDPESVIIDYTLGNKNKDNDILQVIILLSKYVKSGNIILWDEYNYCIYNTEVINQYNVDSSKVCRNFDYDNTIFNIDNEKGKDLFYEDLLYHKASNNELDKSKYDKLLNRIKKNTGVETISLTLDSNNIIVDDYSIPKCLAHVTTLYNAMYIVSGDNLKVGITDQDLVDFNILPLLTKMDRFITEYPPTPNIDDMLNWLKENSKGTNFTDKVKKLGFSIDGLYYTALCSINQLNTVSHNIPVYKDGNRLGKKKTYEVLKKKQEIIQNRITSIQNGTAEFLSSEELDNIIAKKQKER